MNVSSTAVVSSKKRNPLYKDLSFQVFLGMCLGVALAYVDANLAVDMKLFGDAFIHLIQMLIGPIIFCTVCSGIAKVQDMKKVGRVAVKALLYFEVVTSLALVLGLVVMNILRPGAGMNIDPSRLDASAVDSYITQAHHAITTSEFLLNIIPMTVIGAFARGDILQILFFSVLFAFGLSAVGDRAKPVVDAIDSISSVLFWMIGIAMKVAPIGAFGAIAFTVGKFGLESLLSLGKLVIVFYFICSLFFALILFPICHASGFSLLKLMRYIRTELLLVLGTASSESVFPKLLTKLERLGCQQSVVGLVLPTAYTFNHDGTCLYFAGAAVFLAQATNTNLSWQGQLGLLLVLLLTSKGAAGVSGAALVVLAVTLAATNTIPVASMALILGIHRVLASAFVFTNIAGNCVATIVVASWEGALDRQQMDTELNSGWIE